MVHCIYVCSSSTRLLNSPPTPKTLGTRTRSGGWVCVLVPWLDTRLGCGSITASLSGFCGSLMVSISVLSFHIFISGVTICFGTSHFCFPHISPSFPHPCWLHKMCQPSLPSILLALCSHGCAGAHRLSSSRFCVPRDQGSWILHLHFVTGRQ